MARTKSQKKRKNKLIVGGVFLSALIAGSSAALILSGSNQDIRNQASMRRGMSTKSGRQVEIKSIKKVEDKPSNPGSGGGGGAPAPIVAVVGRFSNWTDWSDQYGDISALIPGQGASQRFSSFTSTLLSDNRIKQIALNEAGNQLWYRYATWNGTGFANWTAWNDQYGDLSSLIPGQGSAQTFNSFSSVLLPDGRFKQVALTRNGQIAWVRYATWVTANNRYENWTTWTSVDFKSLIPGQGSMQSFNSFSSVVFPDNRIKQIALSRDGQTAWVRYADWNGSTYTNWTNWTSVDFKSLLPGEGSNQSFSSYNSIVFPNNKIKQEVLLRDANSDLYSSNKNRYRYAEWDGVFKTNLNELPAKRPPVERPPVEGPENQDSSRRGIRPGF